MFEKLNASRAEGFPGPAGQCREGGGGRIIIITNIFIIMTLGHLGGLRTLFFSKVFHLFHLIKTSPSSSEAGRMKPHLCLTEEKLRPSQVRSYSFPITEDRAGLRVYVFNP